MKRHSSSSVDWISRLPCNIIQTILMLLSLRDMVRTSVLSKEWRYQWTRVPQLLFEDPRNFYEVFGMLSLHEGPILKFSLDMNGWDNCFQISEIIRYLSRNGVQELKISKTDNKLYTLPSSIFSCAGLNYLSLKSCVFKPLALDGFSKLKSLYLYHVELDSHVSISSCPFLERLKIIVLTNVDNFSVDAPRLKNLILGGPISYIGFMNTPLLKRLSLYFQEYECSSEKTFGLTRRLLCSVPHLENLLLYFSFLACLASGVSPNKLPTALNNLKKLELVYVDLQAKDELLSTLWLIRNSPNLQILKIEAVGSFTEHELDLEMVDHTNYYLMELKEVRLAFTDNVPKEGLRLAKFLLDISPVLEKLYFGPYLEDPDEEESEDMLELESYPRASPKAEFVFRFEYE